MWRPLGFDGPYSRMDICKTFGENVRRLRRAKEISQEELAHMAGIHRTYLSQVERHGGRNPTIKVVQRIAEALGTTMGDLLDTPPGVVLLKYVPPPSSRE